MQRTHKRHLRRTLAIDPSPQGFGFAVLEGPDRLLDWGINWARGDKNASCLRGTEGLINWYAPHSLVVEDTRGSASLRRERIRSLFPKLRKLAAHTHVTFEPIRWAIVRDTVGGSPRATKETLAAAIATRFGQLASRLPPHRKIWKPEDPRMSIFDAVALAITAIERGERGLRSKAS